MDPAATEEATAAAVSSQLQFVKTGQGKRRKLMEANSVDLATNEQTATGRCNLQFVTTEKGKRKISMDGYCYVKKKNLAAGKESFECTGRRKSSCYTMIHVRHAALLSKINEYSHPPDAAQNEAASIKHDVGKSEGTRHM